MLSHSCNRLQTATIIHRFFFKVHISSTISAVYILLDVVNFFDDFLHTGSKQSDHKNYAVLHHFRHTTSSFAYQKAKQNVLWGVFHRQMSTQFLHTLLPDPCGTHTQSLSQRGLISVCTHQTTASSQKDTSKLLRTLQNL